MDKLNIKYIDNRKFYNNINYNDNKPDIVNTTRVEINNDVPLIKFTPFEKMPFINHAFSTRLGGVSSGIYKSMNLAFNLEDSHENVINNFTIISKLLNIPIENMVYSKQTHTTNVMKVDRTHIGMGITKDRTYDNIDGLVTDIPEICLVTSYADCVPLFFADPVKKCIGAAHSGWRGTVGNIAKNTISKMQDEFGCNPKDIHVFIGPSICADCYEVSQDVAKQFINAYCVKQAANIVLPGRTKDKYQLNLQMANYYNMINSGICADNIGISDICTCCNSDILFSHRATKGKRGILCGFIYIRSESYE